MASSILLVWKETPEPFGIEYVSSLRI
jgi:hypothetical protein